VVRVVHALRKLDLKEEAERRRDHRLGPRAGGPERRPPRRDPGPRDAQPASSSTKAT
jgi:hypothetical protein